MPSFAKDKYREEVLSEFLEKEFYPEIGADHERIHDEEKQKAGHDARIAFDWLPGPVIADEKAQNSDTWLNDPSPTFVMEIFGESWLTDGEPDGNIGWFVHPDNETEYYILVWLPDVSLFKIESGVDEYPYLTYQPAESVDFNPETLSENARSDIREVTDTSRRWIRFELSRDLIDAFETTAEPLPEIICSGEARYGEWYYEPCHIHEAKVAVVEKAKISESLAADGLTREVLIEKGRQAITEGTVNVETKKAKHIVRSSGNQSGSAEDEDPVILVVWYDTYHELADRTYNYQNGEWSTDVRLF